MLSRFVVAIDANVIKLGSYLYVHITNSYYNYIDSIPYVSS